MFKWITKIAIIFLLLLPFPTFAEEPEIIKNLSMVITVNKNGSVDVLEKQDTVIRKYKAANVLSYFSDHDELNWYLNKSKTKALSASFEINIPGNIDKVSCDNCSTSVEGQKAFIKINKLPLTQDLIFTVAFPKNIVAKSSANNSSLNRNFYLILPLFIFILFWYVVYPLWLPIKLFFLKSNKKINKEDLSKTIKFYNLIIMCAVVTLNIPLAFMVNIYRQTTAKSAGSS